MAHEVAEGGARALERVVAAGDDADGVAQRRLAAQEGGQPLPVVDAAVIRVDGAVGEQANAFGEGCAAQRSVRPTPGHAFWNRSAAGVTTARICGGAALTRRRSPRPAAASSMRSSVLANSRIVCERAALEDLRIHDARHWHASRALALGESLSMIGRLLGDTQMETTARYAHLAKD